MMTREDLGSTLGLLNLLTDFLSEHQLYIGNADLFTADGDDNIATIVYDTDQGEYVIEPVA